MLLGHTCVCAVEIEPYRRKSLLQRQRDGNLPRFPIWDDVRTFDGKPWRGLVDVVCGGFPCQDISSANTSNPKGIEGGRSGLWKQMGRVVGEVRPAIVFVENSARLTCRGLGTVLADLACMGFDARWGVLGAADAIWNQGTPIYDHERYRIFIAATHSDRLRELQSQRRKLNIGGRAGHSVTETTDTNQVRCLYSEDAKEFQDNQNGNHAALERARNRVASPAQSTNRGWWADEPRVGRVVHGMAHRMDRGGAIGDGQVPAVVKLAWETLQSGELT